MSSRHNLKRRGSGDRRARNWRNALGELFAHPARTGLFLFFSLALFWVVLTKSLPYALAPVSPETALMLNPSNPAALIAKAERARDRLLALTALSPDRREERGKSEAELKFNTLVRLPEAKVRGGIDGPPIEQEALRNEIRDLANRTIAADPLNARAFRLLAEVTSDTNEVRDLMQAAATRSRRESAALFWLLNDSYYHKDFEAALSRSDILLRTRPELAAYVFTYLGLIAEDPVGGVLLVNQLAAGPKWRSQFFQVLPRNVRQVNTPFLIMTSLLESGSPPSPKELSPYLDFLIAKNLPDYAYNVWLRFLPKSEMETLALITNGSFENNPSGLPFDWQFQRGLNAVSELVPIGSGGQRALHVRFGTGRVQFPEVSQLVVLAPGRYRLEGRLRGTIVAKRGLRWRMQCAAGARPVLGETDMLMGQSEEWRIFSLEAEVPATEQCRGQAIRLFHDSRSASEELISGEVWFGDLSLRRVSATSAATE